MFPDSEKLQAWFQVLLSVAFLVAAGVLLEALYAATVGY